MKKGFGLLALYLFIPLFAENFDPDTVLESGEKIGTGIWKAEGDLLHLEKSGTPLADPVRRPANLLLLPVNPMDAFQMDLEAKSTVHPRKGADVILIFGYQNELSFYYAHISNDSDNRTHHVIMKVEGEKRVRTPIQLEKNPAPKLNGEWQKIRLVRQADGRIDVYVDDLIIPTLTAKDQTWIKGRIGIGSFNDPGVFRNVRVQPLNGED